MLAEVSVFMRVICPQIFCGSYQWNRFWTLSSYLPRCSDTFVSNEIHITQWSSSSCLICFSFFGSRHRARRYVPCCCFDSGITEQVGWNFSARQVQGWLARHRRRCLKIIAKADKTFVVGCYQKVLLRSNLSLQTGLKQQVMRMTLRIPTDAGDLTALKHPSNFIRSASTSTAQAVNKRRNAHLKSIPVPPCTADLYSLYSSYDAVRFVRVRCIASLGVLAKSAMLFYVLCFTSLFNLNHVSDVAYLWSSGDQPVPATSHRVAPNLTWEFLPW